MELEIARRIADAAAVNSIGDVALREHYTPPLRTEETAAVVTEHLPAIMVAIGEAMAAADAAGRAEILAALWEMRSDRSHGRITIY